MYDKSKELSVVKYHNDLNTMPMRNWTSEEMDLFFAILAQMKDKGTQEVVFDKHQLQNLVNSTYDKNKQFADIMAKFMKNVSTIHYLERTSNSLKLMLLFQYFEAKWSDDLSDMTLTVQVSPKFEYILNRLNAEFTKYELDEFLTIRSTYAKTMYRILKQWKKLGKKEFKFEDFKVLLDMPKSYTPSEIDKAVLAPIMRELPSFFENLKVKKVKSNKRGNPVIAYEFTWEAEQTEVYIPGKFHHTQKKKFFTERPYDHESVVAQQQKDIEQMFGKDFNFDIEKLKQEQLKK